MPKTNNIEHAAQSFFSQGAELVAITDGENGSHIFSKQVNQTIEYYFQPAFKLDKVVDTTGCGDVYHGVFLSCLVAGMTLQESALRATAAAAINTQRIGGRGMLSSMSEILEFINSYKVIDN